MALCFRINFKQAKTIALETGIQNVGIAFLTIISTLNETNSPPEALELAQLPLIAVALLTPIPLYILFAVVKFQKYVLQKFRSKNETEETVMYSMIPTTEQKV